MAVETIPNLRPMKIGQILDRAIRLYRQNFISFIGIVAIVQVPVAILQVFINQATFSNLNEANFSVLGLPIISILLSFIFIQGIGTAAMTRAVADNYLGEKTGAVEAYRKIGRGWLSLVAALFVLVLVSIGASLWFLVPCIGWLTGLGILIYLWLVISPLIAPTIVLEGQGAWGGWRRAWELARQRFWWVLGFFLVLYLFNMLVVTGPSTLITLVLTFFWDSSAVDSATIFTIQTIVQQLVALAFSLIFLPFQLAATTLAYFDLRVRSEGFDLALQLPEVEGGKIEAAELTAAAPRAARGSLITFRELAYFFGISLIPIALYGALLGIFTIIVLAFGYGFG